MASASPEPIKRSLPARRNHLLAPEETPSHGDLVGKRRLGQTNLTVKPGQIGTTSATKPGNLGQFDYAHLRAPLPKNLKGSEIFAPQKHQPHPEAYFLMRRSVDGFISATGMFKLAFPWAQHAEEAAERDYIKSLRSSSQDEVAGNVWISESFALELAHDYNMVPWIVALLDETDVKNSDDAKKSIAPPPKYKLTASDKAHLLPREIARASTPGRGRGRPRATTPSKGATPATKAGSPRKQRTTKATKEANAAAAKEANASLQATLEKEAEAAELDSVESEKSINGEKASVKIESTTQVNGNSEITTTALKFELPGGSAELPPPTNPEQMIKEAQLMVEEAKKLEEPEGSSERGKPSKGKRKADEIADASDEVVDDEQQRVKRAKLLEQQLTRERVRNRALMGVAATLAIGAVIPFFV